jgi:anti-sigma B factor antagonist
MQCSLSPQEPQELYVEACPAGRGVAFIRLPGEADLYAAPMLRDALDRAIASGAGLIVIDLTGVTFIDSMMLGVLLGVTRQTRARGISTRVVADDPHVWRMFELTLLDRVLTLYRTVELAVADRSASD